MLRTSHWIYEKNEPLFGLSGYVCVCVWDSVVGQIFALLMHPEAAAQKAVFGAPQCVPTPRCHIACMCKHACDSCVSELHKNAGLWREEKIGRRAIFKVGTLRLWTYMAVS
ncbi:hypothetical protein GOODEAATRI_005079 [Goodea atripinnis]|uniref:Uncharacterized protein n=1 Tax=Goodea atripinnis TaxID=208336 RepID=A0ABV0P1J2_9TELE